MIASLQYRSGHYSFRFHGMGFLLPILAPIFRYSMLNFIIIMPDFGFYALKVAISQSLDRVDVIRMNNILVNITFSSLA